MTRDEAMRALGVRETQVRDASALRTAYRRKLMSLHPDVNASAGAEEDTARITAAYRLLRDSPATGSRSGPASRGTTGGRRPAPRRGGGAARSDTRSTPSASRPAPNRPTVKARAVDASTIRVEGSKAEVLAAVIETAQRLGEVAYYDRAAGLVEAVVEFVEAPTSSVVMTLQGRASGTVDVFCSVEPLSGGDSPPPAAVTRLVASTMAGIPLAELVI